MSVFRHVNTFRQKMKVTIILKAIPIMAWFCSGLTQLDLVDHLIRRGVIQSAPVAAAMKAVDRQVAQR
jgi:hypothetical protein